MTHCIFSLVLYILKCSESIEGNKSKQKLTLQHMIQLDKIIKCQGYILSSFLFGTDSGFNTTHLNPQGMGVWGY